MIETAPFYIVVLGAVQLQVHAQVFVHVKRKLKPGGETVRRMHVRSNTILQIAVVVVRGNRKSSAQVFCHRAADRGLDAALIEFP